MSDPGSPDLGASVSASLSTAAKALDDFVSGPVASATQSIDSAVTKSFTSVTNTIARAATSGKSSIDQLVNAILADFDRVAASQFIAKPIEGIAEQLASSLFSVSGARAAGGPVDAGSAYLVGEEGPELFVPSSSGAIAPSGSFGAARPQITLNVQARDAQSFLKSETQVAAMLARAVARGQRNM